MMRTYYVPGARRIKGQRLTLRDRFGMWKKRRQRMKELVWF